jgi:hypothetical protein
VVRVKLEYAPQLGWEVRHAMHRYASAVALLSATAVCAAQEVTAKERAGWWAALMLRPGANVVVWRVGVADSALLAAERKDLASVQSDSETPGSRLRVRARRIVGSPRAV